MLETAYPAQAPRWIPLPFPVSSVEMPSFIVGNQLSPGCWTPAPINEKETTASVVTWTAEKEAKLAIELKTAFGNKLAEVGLEASLLSALKDKWEVTLEGPHVAEVDPATIAPNFKNGNCVTPALGWFKNERVVVTQAIKAKVVRIAASSQTTEEQRAQLDAAIKQINVKFQTGFERTESGSETLLVTAKDAFVGVNGTALTVVECTTKDPFEVTSGTPVKVCDGEYEIVVEAATEDRYTLEVTPKAGDTARFDLGYGTQEMLTLGTSRIAYAMVRKREGKLTVDALHLLLVGAGGGEQP